MSNLNIDELANSLKRAEQTLIKLIEVSDQVTPKLKKDITEMTEKIEGGFNIEKLRKQVTDVADFGFDASKLKSLETQLENVSKKLTEAVEKSTDRINYYQKSANTHLNHLMYGVIGLVCSLVGSGIAFTWEYNRIDRYQDTIHLISLMNITRTSFINSTCDMKKSYGKFVGKPITCDKEWANTSGLE